MVEVSARATGTVTATTARGIGLDVLRGLAALGVLITHVAFVTGVVNPARWDSTLREVLPRLDVGVWVFFVLSGLLVSRPFVRAALAGTSAAGAPVTGTYLLRRAVRVMPLYWVVLAVTLLTDPGPLPGAGQLGADVLLLHIYWPAWAIGPITQSWSLATEVAFYVFLPVWFAAMGRWFARRGIVDRRTRARWLAGGLVGWVAVAFVYRVAVVAATDTFDFTRAGAVDVRGALLTWLPNHLDTFAIGVGLALFLEWARLDRPGRPLVVTLPWRLGCYALSFAALWVASTRLDLPPLFTGFDGGQTLARHALFLICAGAAVAPSALATAAGRAPRVGPAVGRIWTGIALGSYGVYLWHQWVTEHWFEWRDLTEFDAPFPTTLAVVIAGASALAALTYHVVERPSLAALRAAIAGQGQPKMARQLGVHPAFDGIRGLSIAAVLASHVIFLDEGNGTWALEGGFLGVDVFLVLSGFLIGATLLREVDRTGRVSMPDFLRRRARRLLPPLIGFFVIHAIVTALLGDSMREELLQMVLALTFVGNWQLTFGHQPPYDLVHLWSLAVEGQLYLMLGFIVEGVRDLVRRRPWAVVGLLVVAAAATALWRYANYRAGLDPIALYERTDIRADSMLIGLAVAVVWRSHLVTDAWLRVAGAIGGAVLVAAIAAARPGSGWLFQGGFAIVAVAASLMVGAATLDGGLVTTVGSWSLLRWLGRISYSLYLWHLPIFVWVVRAAPDAPLGVKVVVSVTAALVVAQLAYRMFEAPYLATWRRRGSQPQADTLMPVGTDSR
jgi:peptidoglycan/LPS O-acetylase OafA/YrhL